jgi:hypothetical protein
MDNNNMDLREIEQDGMDLIDLAEDRDKWRILVKEGMNLRVPLNAGKGLSSCTTGGHSRRSQFHGISLLSNTVKWYCQSVEHSLVFFFFRK